MTLHLLYLDDSNVFNLAEACGLSCLTDDIHPEPKNGTKCHIKITNIYDEKEDEDRKVAIIWTGRKEPTQEECQQLHQQIQDHQAELER